VAQDPPPVALAQRLDQHGLAFLFQQIVQPVAQRMVLHDRLFVR
jgi:hypothetical protein